MTTLKSQAFFTPRDLAQRWNTSEKTLERWRMEGTGPVYFKIGGRVLYGAEHVQSHELGRMRAATGRALPPAIETEINIGHDASTCA